MATLINTIEQTNKYLIKKLYIFSLEIVGHILLFYNHNYCIRLKIEKHI